MTLSEQLQSPARCTKYCMVTPVVRITRFAAGRVRESTRSQNLKKSNVRQTWQNYLCLRGHQSDQILGDQIIVSGGGPLSGRMKYKA
jgi:hypothetical protein